MEEMMDDVRKNLNPNKYRLFDDEEYEESGNTEEERIETKENLIGPVKQEFEELQIKINEKT